MFSRLGSAFRQNARAYSTSAKAELSSNTKKAISSVVGVTGLTLGYIVYQDTQTGKAMTAAEHGLQAPEYEWSHKGMFDSFDHASIRRGFQVYREVCSACHSLDRISWRNLVGVSHTASEAKAMAAEFEYDDEPDDQGNPRKRPGKLTDPIPGPYANEQAARAANGGALPPDLSLIIKARHGGCDYVFSLLTGYPEEPPAGVQLAPGANYNPYFPGGSIAMARVLFDDLVEYEDGTPASTSQEAKDVVTFLNWCSEPEHDERKKMGVKALLIVGSLYLLAVWTKKFKWTPIKHRKIVFNPPKPPKRR